MTVRDLVQQYCPHDVPVYYHNGENRKLFFSTRILSAPELTQFGRATETEKPLGIYLFDTTVDEAFTALHNQSQENTRIILDLIARHIGCNENDKFLLVLFSVLHEVGHWTHFVESGLNGVEYWSTFGVPSDDLQKQYLFESMLVTNSGSATALYKKFAQAYRHLPIEEAADEYALTSMKNIFQNNGGVSDA